MARPPEPSEPGKSEAEKSPDSRRRSATIAWTSTTYLGEGLPWSVLHQMSAEAFTSLGLPARMIGFTAALHATNALKVVISPVLALFGTLRAWMVGMQAVMGCAVGLLAMLVHGIAEQADPGAADTTWIWVTLVVIGLCSATHDIACDGYYMEALDDEAQAEYSGVRIAAFRAAMFLGSSVLVYLAGAFDWRLGFGAAAAIVVGLSVGHHMLLPRVEAAVAPAASNTAAHWTRRLPEIRRAYTSFLTQDKVFWVVAFLVSYKLGDVLMFNMSKVLFREMGIGTDIRGILNGFGIGASIAGGIVGGMWIARRGLAATLGWITVGMAVTEPLYVILASVRPGLVVTGSILAIEQFFGGMATSAQVVFIMRRCHPDHKAAHFAFATALYSSALLVVGVYSGIVYEAVGAVDYFWIASIATLPAVVLVRFVPR